MIKTNDSSPVFAIRIIVCIYINFISFFSLLSLCFVYSPPPPHCLYNYFTRKNSKTKFPKLNTPLTKMICSLSSIKQLLDEY